MTTRQPDIFTNVHKGIRRALFASCVALGRAEGDTQRETQARSLLAEALHFVAHHGENEDLLLLPLLRAKAPEVAAKMSADHAALDAEREALGKDYRIAELHLAACAFTGRYLDHLDEEERVLEKEIRATLTSDELGGFSKASVERTTDGDKKMMIGWMLPGMTPGAVEGFVGGLPETMRESMRRLAEG